METKLLRRGSSFKLRAAMAALAALATELVTASLLQALVREATGSVNTVAMIHSHFLSISIVSCVLLAVADRRWGAGTDSRFITCLYFDCISVILSVIFVITFIGVDSIVQGSQLILLVVLGGVSYMLSVIGAILSAAVTLESAQRRRSKAKRKI